LSGEAGQDETFGRLQFTVQRAAGRAAVQT
jgi:hypothetical protein